MKAKKCKVCKESFEPTKPLQVVCSYVCGLHYSRGVMHKENKKKKAETKEKLKTKSQHLKELQVIFNKYIRLRDADEPCISCGIKIIGTSHASHFFSVGSTPGLRFDENNVHASCEKCNLHLHGNQFEYSIRLPDRIGLESFNELVQKKGQKLMLSIPEITELKKVYNAKIKSIEKDNV